MTTPRPSRFIESIPDPAHPPPQPSDHLVAILTQMDEFEKRKHRTSRASSSSSAAGSAREGQRGIRGRLRALTGGDGARR